MRDHRTKDGRIARRTVWAVVIILLLPMHTVRAQENGAEPKPEGDGSSIKETADASGNTARESGELAAASRLLKEDGSLDLDAAVEYFEDLYRSESSIAEAELKIVRPDSERTLEMKGLLPKSFLARE